MSVTGLTDDRPNEIREDDDRVIALTSAQLGAVVAFIVALVVIFRAIRSSES